MRTNFIGCKVFGRQTGVSPEALTKRCLKGVRGDLPLLLIQIHLQCEHRMKDCRLTTS